MKKIILLLSLFVALFAHAQRYPVADKSPGQSFTAAEWNLMKKSINGVPVVDIDVAQLYGVVAGGFDNYLALMQMNGDIAGYGKPWFNLYFPSGLTASTNERWLDGVVNVDIFGSGNMSTSMAAIYSGTDEKFQRPILMCDMYQDSIKYYTGAPVYTTTYKLFNTVLAGSTRIQLKTAADTTLYHKGDRVLLSYFEQVGNGYPPGSRYNEWNVIDSNNIGSGYISFMEGIKFSYDSATHDVPNILGSQPSGKPRITNLDRGNKFIYAQHVGVHNITFLPPIGAHDSSAVGTCLLIGEDVVVDHCNVYGNIWPTQSKKTTLSFVRQLGSPKFAGAEFDKICGVVLVNDCFFQGQVVNGSSIDYIKIVRTKMMQSVQLSPRNLWLEDNDIYSDKYADTNTSPIQSNPGTYPMHNYVLKNNNYYVTAANKSSAAVNFGQARNYTITNMSGSTIIIPNTGGTGPTNFAPGNTNSGLVYTMEIGTMLCDTAGMNGKFASIKRIYFDITYTTGGAQGAFKIDVSGATFTVGETITWSTVKNYIDDGTNVYKGPFKSNFTNYGDDAIWFANKGGSGTENIIKLTQESFDWSSTDRQSSFLASFNSLEINVIQPFSGSDSQCFLTVADDHGNEFFHINLKIAGRRLLTRDSGYYAQSGDVFLKAYMGKFLKTTHQYIFGPLVGGAKPFALGDQTESSRAIFELKANLTRPVKQ